MVNQTSDYQNKLFEQQQQFISDWITILKGESVSKPETQWYQSVQTIESLIHGLIDSQKQSLLKAINDAKDEENITGTLSEWMPNLDENIEQWYGMQLQFWDTWFDTLRTAGPADYSGRDTFVQSWQDIGQQMRDYQSLWLKTSPTEKSAATKVRKKSPAKKKTSAKKTKK